MASKRRASAQGREREIGRRVVEIRERMELSQPEFAAKLEIRRERLASYEVGRVALRHDVGLEICRVFNVNLHWLVTGEGPYFPFSVFNFAEYKDRIRYKAPLSEAYDLVLAAVVPKPSGFKVGVWVHESGPIPADLKKKLHDDIEFCFQFLPKEVWLQFATQISGAASEFLFKAKAVTEQPSLKRKS